MNYQRLKQKDKEQLIRLILEKDKLLREFTEHEKNMEQIGEGHMDGRHYWLWRERVE